MSKTETAVVGQKDPHVSADGHRPTKSEIWRLGIGFTFSAVICAIPWVALSSLVLPATLNNIDPSSKEAILGMINAIGSIVALLANFIFGALSDNTRSRFGRRTPWIIAGGLVAGISMGLIALFQTNVPMVTIL
jgi:MFS family permease